MPHAPPQPATFYLAQTHNISQVLTQVGSGTSSHTDIPPWHNIQTVQQGGITRVTKTQDSAKCGKDEEPSYEGQFRGDYRGVAWNAQALFAAKASRYNAKAAKISQFLQHNHFALIEETHGLSGREDALDLNTPHQSFWAHGNASWGGVGIIVKESFLSRFHPVTQESWIVIEEDRAGRLRLKGSEGNLDIVVVYLETGGEGKRSRQRTLNKVYEGCKHRSKVLTILAGDLSFVASKMDRFNKDPGTFVGDEDEEEEKDFKSKWGKEGGFMEWDMEGHTCETGQVRSRIDRALSNHYASDQLDHDFSCGAYSTSNLSMHRPIFFRRTSSSRISSNKAGVIDSVVGHPGWQNRVTQWIRDKIREERARGNEVDDMLRCKETMQEVSEAMHKEGLVGKEKEEEDELGWSLRCIKTAAEVKVSRADKCIQALPWLKDFVSQGDANARLKPGFIKLKEKAYEMAVKRASDLLNDIADHTDEEPGAREAKRGEAAKIIRRLTPGGGESIGVVEGDGGLRAESNEDIARVLSKHWASVFKAKGVNRRKLLTWLEGITPKHKEVDKSNGRAFGEGEWWGLDRREEKWKIELEDVERAIKHSNNSMCGPDGIPYRAWRALGKEGAVILHEVAKQMQEEGFADKANAAYGRRGGDGNSHKFNLGNMCCLPKKASSVDESGKSVYKR